MIKSIPSCRDGDQLKANNVITRNESRLDRHYRCVWILFILLKLKYYYWKYCR